MREKMGFGDFLLRSRGGFKRDLTTFTLRTSFRNRSKTSRTVILAPGTVKRRGFIWGLISAQNGHFWSKLLKEALKHPLGEPGRSLLLLMPLFPGPAFRPEAPSRRPSKVQKVTTLVVYT